MLDKNILKRRQCIPIIYTSGTHYDVGFDVGRNFASIIHSFVNTSETLNKESIPAYHTKIGKKAYDDTLKSVQKNFPQYIKELEGTAEGANVPFYKLFLLNMDDIILTGSGKENNIAPLGCSSICLNNPNQEILGHSEDALKETLNHFYFVSAHITSQEPQGRWKVTEERFTSLCYAGHLPGYTMSNNHHGLVFSINTLQAQGLRPGKTPRMFLTRAVLAAENFSQVENILRDQGTGAGSACSLNVTFLNQPEGRTFYNIEMAPAKYNNESQLNIVSAKSGEKLMHCNHFLRIQQKEANEFLTTNSMSRQSCLESQTPNTKEDIIDIYKNTECPIFCDNANDYASTLAVGIFDLVDKTWSIYADNPKKSKPIVVLPLLRKNE